VPADVNGDELVRSRLPSPTTDLLGRDSDIEVVLTMLSRDSVRMLTLVGPPGVGKTRLAIQLARTLEGQYQHGALFVALAAIPDGALIADAILQALGVTSNTRNPLAQVKHVLHRRNMVLVLDNFEHLLEHVVAEVATGVVAELVATAPSIKVLVTSRAPLRLSGEHLYEVPALAPAVARDLFVQRATALSPSFNPRPHDEGAMAGICRRLDYLPLAIELAAARIRLFEPSTLLKRLAEPFAVLTVGPTDLPLRQRTLRNAIDWSYTLLTPEEQVLFRRLSIFADGCTMTMIEAVAGDGLINPIVDLTQSLVDKSMLKAEPVNGAIRFRLLEMLREYASELLFHSSEATTIAKRSAQWLVDQVQTM
jgi:predicted ATPase